MAWTRIPVKHPGQNALYHDRFPIAYMTLHYNFKRHWKVFIVSMVSMRIKYFCVSKTPPWFLQLTGSSWTSIEILAWIYNCINAEHWDVLKAVPCLTSMAVWKQIFVEVWNGWVITCKIKQRCNNLSISKSALISGSKLGFWGRLNIKMPSCKYNPMLKIKRSHDCLIFNMGIPIPGEDGLCIETGPWSPRQWYSGWQRMDRWRNQHTTSMLVNANYLCLWSAESVKY